MLQFEPMRYEHKDICAGSALLTCTCVGKIERRRGFVVNVPRASYCGAHSTKTRNY